MLTCPVSQSKLQTGSDGAGPLSAFIMAVSIATVFSFVVLAVSLLLIKDLRLPYPCCDSVVHIPEEHRPTPSDLFGPYAPNRHLQKAKKLFEHQITGVGRCCSFGSSVCMCMRACRSATLQTHSSASRKCMLDNRVDVNLLVQRL